MFDAQIALSEVTAPPDRRSAPRRAFRSQRRPTERIHLLGQPIDLVRREEVMQQIEAWIEAGQKRIVANHNLHSLYLIRRDAGMQAMYDIADLIELDSAPLVAFGKMLGLPMRPFHRCTYLDWRDHFWSLADRKGWRVAYVGGADGVATSAAERLSMRYPGTTILGLSGFFDMAQGSAGNGATLATVRDFRPDIVLVGMGMPRQEAWIAQNIDVLPDAVVLPVGAAFDYEAGVQKAAPRWMGPLGLEWAFRLVADPRRLFTRYCVEPWFLISPTLADVRAAVQRRKVEASAVAGKEALALK